MSLRARTSPRKWHDNVDRVLGSKPKVIKLRISARAGPASELVKSSGFAGNKLLGEQ